MAKNGNGEGGITRHKKSGLYMARYTSRRSPDPSARPYTARRVEKWTRSSPQRRQIGMVG
jgi:hypothetical protein